MQQYTAIRVIFSIALLVSQSELLSGIRPSQQLFEPTNQYIQTGRFENALRQIDSLLDYYSDNSSIVASLLLKKGEIYFETGEPDNTQKLLQLVSANNVNDIHQHNELQFEYYFLKGCLSNYYRDFGQAHQWLQKAQHSLENHAEHDSTRYSKLYRELAYTWFWQLEPIRAAEFYRRAIEECPANTLYEKAVRTTLRACLATTLMELYEFEKVHELMDSCETFINSIETPLPPALLDACLIVGDYYFNFHENKYNASRFYQMALAILDACYVPDFYKYAPLYYSLGRVQYISSCFEKGLSYFEQSLQLSNNCPALHDYRFLNCRWIAVYYQGEGNTEKALEYNNMAIKYVKGTYNSLAYTYISIGRTYKKYGDTARAIDFYHKAIKEAQIQTGFDNHTMLADSYFELGVTYKSMHSLDTAYHYLNLAKELILELAPKGMLASSIPANISEIYNERKDYLKALKYNQQSIIAACNTFIDTSILANPDIHDTYLNSHLMKAFNRKSDYFYYLYENNPDQLQYLEASLTSSDLGIKVFEKTVIGIENDIDELNYLGTGKNYIQDAIERAYLLFKATQNHIYAEKTLQYAEKSKMLTMRIYLHKEQVKKYAGIPDSIINQVNMIRDRILETEYQLVSAISYKLPDAHINDLKRKLSDYYISNDMLSRTMETEFPAYYNLKYNFGNEDLEKLQKVIKKNQVLIEYQIMRSSIFVFLVDKKTIRIIKQDLPEDFYSNLNTFRSSIAQNPLNKNATETFNSLVASSRKLYDILISPVEQFIRKKNLIIVPHNELNYIPFEVLLSRNPNSSIPNYKTLEYLCKDHSIRYVFSWNWLLTKDRDLPTGTRTAVFLPDYEKYNQMQNMQSQKLPVLEGAEYEAMTACQIMGGTLYSNLKATERDFKNEATKYNIIHLISHSNIDDQIPVNSNLILTSYTDTVEDGYLYAYELLQMDLNARLIVLSGCNTGYGKLRKGEGMLSLARCFFYTGVQTMAYTLWPVADQASAQLINNFYRNLKNMHNIDKAMHTARLKYIKEADPVKCHPFYWAGYIITGNNHSFFRLRNLLIPTAITILVIALTFRKKIRYKIRI